MKTISINQIKDFAKTHTAVEFDKWCDENKVFVEWLDVTLTNLNDGDYNVYLPNYAIGVQFYNGKLEEIA
jgi:hypothetical protein